MTAQTVTAPTTTTDGGPLAPGDMGYSTMPAGLTAPERHAYFVGFARGERAGIKKGATGAVPTPGGLAAFPAGSAARKMLARRAAEAARADRATRHPASHKAGMSALRAYWRRAGLLETRAAEVTDPCAPARKTPTRRKSTTPPAPAAVVDVVEVVAAAPVVEVTPADELAPDNSPDAVESRRVMFANLGWSTSPAAPAAAVVDVSPVTPTAPAADPDRVAAVIAASDVPDPAHGKRATRRAVAAALRGAGLPVAGPTWAHACTLAGLPTGADR